MSDLAGVLCGLTIFLAIVTVVGHGIWVLLAMIVRALSDQPPETPPKMPPTPSTPLNDVRAAIREINGFHARNEIGDRLYRGLLKLLREKEARLTGTVAAASPPEPTSVPAEPPAALPIGKPAELPAAPAPQTPPLISTGETNSSDVVIDAFVVPDDATTSSVPSEKTPLQTPSAPAAPVPPVASAAPATPPEAVTPEAAHPTVFKARPATPATTAASSAPAPPQAVAAPAEPRRPFSDLLQAFMEEKNIRWGEIVSGILIVGSAIGLVISLWATLSEWFPYFPALLFLSVTAGIFGAGMYTLRKWKLESTSRGLLIISLLLIPLNFLAAIAISQGQQGMDALYLFVVAVGMVAYGAITFGAARVLVPHAVWPCIIAVMGASGGQLLIDRQAGPGASANLLFALPLGSFLAGTLAHLFLIRPRPRLSSRLANETFLLLGAAAFALVMPLALLVYKTKAIFATLSELAPLLTTVAAVAIGIGLAIQQRMVRAKWVQFRMAGTWLSVCGGALMLLLVLLTWPDPVRLVAVGLMVFAAMEVLVVVSRLPILHAPAVVSLAMAVLLGFHIMTGEFEQVGPTTGWDIARVFLLGQTSVVLSIVTLATLGAAWLMRMVERNDDVPGLIWGAVPVGSVALLSSLVAGFLFELEGAPWASLVLTLGSLTLMLVGGRIRRGWVTCVGSSLLLLALFQVCWFNGVLVSWLTRLIPEHIAAVLFPFLLHASVSCLIAVCPYVPAVRRWLGGERPADFWRPMILPLTIWAIVVSSLVVLPTLLFSLSEHDGWHALCAFWIAGIWLVVALLQRWQVMFWAFQAMATAGVCLSVTALFSYEAYSPSLFGLPHMFSQVAALAAWSTIWSFVRRDCRRWGWLHHLMTPRWPAVDRLCLYVSVVGVLVISVAGCLSGIDAELGAYVHAAGHGAGPMGVLPRSFDFLSSHVGESAALIVALLLFWSLGSLLAWSLGAFRRSPAAVAMIGVAVLGTGVVWLLARVGITVWEFDDAHIRFAWSATAWWLLLAVVVAVAVSFMNRVSTVDLVSLVSVAFAAPLLIAARFESVGATATAFCWGFALCGLAAAALVWARKPLTIYLIRRARLAARSLRSLRVESLSALALLLSSFPVLMVSLAHILPVVERQTADLPFADTLLGHLRLLAWYGGPLVVLAITLIGYAVRERSPLFALAGSLLINVAVTLVSVFLVWAPHSSSDVLVVVSVLQWNALTLGVVGLAWLAGRRWIEAVAVPGEKHWQRLFGVPLGIQVTLLLLVTAVLTGWAIVEVVLFPSQLPESARLLSGVPGWCVLALAVTVGGWYFRSRIPEWEVHLAGCLALSAVALTATAMHAVNGPENWLAFHVLSGGWWLVALVATSLSCVGTYLTRQRWLGRSRPAKDFKNPSAFAAGSEWLCRAARPLAIWATAAGTAVVMLAIRSNWIHFEAYDPYRPWWAVGLAGGCGLLAVALALRERNQPYAYGSVVLAIMASVFYATSVPERPPANIFIDVLLSATIAAAASSLIWVGVEVFSQRRWASVFDPAPRRVPVHHTSAVLSVTLLSVLVGVYLFVQILSPDPSQKEAVTSVLEPLSGVPGWLALAMVGLLLCSSLWDRTAAHGLASLYAWGLVVAGVIIQCCHPTVPEAIFGVGVTAGCYALLTGLMWACRRWLTAAARMVAVAAPESAGEGLKRWLPAGSICLAGLAALIALGGSLLFAPLWMRLGATAAVALAGVGVAAIVDTRFRESLQQIALILGGVVAIALGWAVMTPVPVVEWLPRDFWLPRTIRLMVMLAATAFIYGVGLPRLLSRGNDWRHPIRQIAVVAGGLGGAALILVLVLEILVFDPTVSASLSQILIVAAALVGLVITLISLAVQRGSDPLGLSERGRRGYVYAAEALAGLLFLHFYLTMPELFGGIFLPYWPFIVMGIAFFAVGAGEVLQRAGTRVLSEPLTNTGVFLPLLPAIGFWVGSSDPTMTGFTTVLFTIGLLYVLLSIWRGSFAYVVMAALAGNATLWAMLTDFDWSPLEHPQFFLIPPALCVLVAVHLNRDRLTEAQRVSARYSSLMVIYVASTGEMFLHELGEKLWPPMVLASLAILGVLAGMLLRVRAFVYLGTSFLLLAVLSMVWYAAQAIEHSWPWWAFGIVTGILILAMFAVFEKKRNEIHGALDTFRTWEQ